MIEGFESRIMPEPNSGCWIWTGAIWAGGYGQIKNRTAHRYLYEILVGPVPEGLVLDHLCRVRCCVNPAHLEPVTHRENIMRGVGHAAENARKTHCIHGHEYSPANTRINSYGFRVCRECKRVIDRNSKRRVRAKQRALSSESKP